MFLILIAVVGNAALLSLIVGIIIQLPIYDQHVMLWQIFVLCHMLIMFTTLITFVPLWYKVIGMFKGWRLLTAAELEICQSIFTELSQKYDMNNINLLIKESDEIKVFSAGYANLVMTSSLVQIAAKNEISRQLEDALPYLYYRDNIRTTALIMANWVVLVINWSYSVYQWCTCIISQFSGGIIVKILSMVLFLFFSPFILLHWLTNGIITNVSAYLNTYTKIRAAKFKTVTNVKKDIVGNYYNDLCKMTLLLFLVGGSISFLLYNIV